MLSHDHWISVKNFSLLHVGRLPLVQLPTQYNNSVIMDYKFLPVSSAFVVPSLVLMGSTAVVGGFSSILSLSTGTLNIHSWANASTSESG